MSQIETCFFERYAIATLQTMLGHRFDGLVNRDRPDLQSPDGRTLGIEVTRAMEQSKEAAELMLDNVAGLAPDSVAAEDLSRVMKSGYGYGLPVGRLVGSKEAAYWNLAQPLRQILKSKISKATCGLYGEFDSMELFIFCKDPLSDAAAFKALKYAMELQRYADRGYDSLYLHGIGELHVCNLKDGVSDSARLSSFPISMELRRWLYMSAV